MLCCSCCMLCCSPQHSSSRLVSAVDDRAAALLPTVMPLMLLRILLRQVYMDNKRMDVDEGGKVKMPGNEEL